MKIKLDGEESSLREEDADIEKEEKESGGGGGGMLLTSLLSTVSRTPKKIRAHTSAPANASTFLVF